MSFPDEGNQRNLRGSRDSVGGGKGYGCIQARRRFADIF
jgi:hypothetical protein